MKYPTVTLGSAKVPWPALAAALAGAPMLCVVGLHTMMQKRGTPVAGPAANLTVKGQFVAPAMPRPSPETEALALTFSSECAQPFGPSPMINRAPPKAPPPKDPPVASGTDEKAAPVNQPPSPPKPPALTVTSIMEGQGQPFAVINGKIKKVGDGVGKGFKVVSINGTTGEVIIANGKIRSTLQLKRASDGQ